MGATYLKTIIYCYKKSDIKFSDDIRKETLNIFK